MDDLFAAAHKNDARTVAAAIRAGVDPDEPHPRAGTILLQLACQGDAVDVIRELIALGADANLRFTRRSRVDGHVFANHTPLMYVKSELAAKLLIDAGADVDPADERGWTPLAKAALAGNVALSRYLLSKGADPDVKVQYDGKQMKIRDVIGFNIADLTEAIRGGRRDLVESLDQLREVRELFAS
ncbi:ankyrin repeat domain-containing protein [Tahibacter harae]|uniref:Ankyrin repeat domain-containing protein n=1 Tax=Tahibacter harae TaxID=2963937 RepID=A0ABT1QUC7_9GAMM|nr:ankyrin repeat domain-containing protein [Tahibacter harae]MCQ4165882.1 ankyrin repeat domain-containing protein [Tahibacter harae]